MKKFISIIIILIFVILPINVHGEEQEILPAPDWVTTELNADSSKTVRIKTPTYMIDYIDYYEYSTDGFLNVKTLSEAAGGEFIINETCEFSVRYYYGDRCSATYTIEVVINKNTIINCHSTNISIVIPNDSPIPKDISISAYEIINGKDYTAAAAAMGKNISFRLFSVSVTRGGKTYESSEPFSYLFPSDDFDVNNCKIYHINEKGKITEIDSTAELNMIYCETNKTGMFIVAEDKTYSKGDLNGDGKVQAIDARTALRIASKLDDFTEKQLAAGDINKNGKIDASDARKILRFAAYLDII